MDDSDRLESAIEQASMQPRVRAYLEAPLRRPRLVSVSALLALTACLICTLVLPERYRAAARIRVTWGDDDSALWRTDSTAANRVEELRARALDGAALERAVAATESELLAGGGLAPAADAARATMDAVTVRAEGRDVFRIECVHRDPAKAALIANELATVLLEHARKERVRRDEANPARVQTRLVEARRSMDQAEDAIRRFREGAPPDATGEPPLGSRLNEIYRDKRAVTRDLRVARDRAELLRRATEGRPSTGGPPTSVPNELEELHAELNQLLERYTEEHPDVQALRERIRRAEGAARLPGQAGADPGLVAESDELLTVEQKIEALEEKARNLDAERARPLHDAQSEQRVARSLEELVADYDDARTSYRALYSEWQRAEIDNRTQGPLPRFDIVESANAPETPYFPDRRLFVLVGIALGMALGLGLALLAEIRDVSIKGPGDLREILPPPLLAEIPFVNVQRSRRRR